MILIWVSMGLAIFFVLLNGFASSGKLEPNGIVGIRTWATKHDERAWNAAHSTGFRASLPYCAAVIAVGTVTLVLLPVQELSEAIGFALMGLFLVGTIITAVFAHRAALNVIAAEQNT